MHVQTPAALRRSLPILLAAVLAVSGVMGCAKQRANMAIKKTQTRIQESKKYNAETHRNADLMTADNKLQEAQKGITDGQFDAALVSAKAAQALATKLLTDTLADDATKHNQQNGIDLDVVRKNKLDSDARFEEIRLLKEQADKDFGKQKYERFVATSLQIRDKVTALLRDLKDRADKNLREADAKYQNFKMSEEGLAEAPKEAAEIEKKLAEFKDMIDDTKRLYLDSEQVSNEIGQLIEQGTKVARKSRSDKLIKILEDKLDRALAEEAETYRLATLRECQSNFQDILKDYNAEKYQEALNAGARLESRLDSLILESKIEAAKANHEKVQTEIRTLGNGKVRDHLPGRIEKVEELEKQAQAEFKQELYPECKKTCKIALEEIAAIMKDFDQKAGDAIDAAAAQLDTADTFLTRMGEIFQTQSSPSADPLEQSFESSKKGLQAQLETIGKNAELLLSKAKVERGEKLYDNAIQSSRKVISRSNRVIHDVYQVVAHNNVMELAKAITDREADGAKDFAADELARAKEALAKSRKMMLGVAEAEKAQAGEKKVDLADLDVAPEAYRPAVASTSEVRAEIESVVQRMKETVRALIDKARLAITKAQEQKAEVYALGTLTTSQQLVEEADALLTAGKHSDSAQKATQARSLALESAVTSAKKWAGEELASAVVEIEKADQAAVEKEALRRLRGAKDKKAQADALFAEAAQLTDAERAVDTLSQSKNLASAAATDAQGARMDKVTRAQQDITSARRFDAWKYDYPILVQAIVLAKQSMESMQAADYETSRVMAEQAAALAKQAMDHTKQVTYHERTRDLTEAIDNVGENGAAYFDQERFLPLLLRLQEIRSGFSVAQFETVSAELDQFESDLLAVAAQTPEAFASMVEAERDRVEKVTKAGAKGFAEDKIAKAEQYLRFAEIDFKKSDSRAAFHNIRNASAALSAIETRLAEIEFATTAVDLLAGIDEGMQSIGSFRTFTKVEFRRVFAVHRVTQTGNAIIEGTDPASFREAMESLVLKSQATKYPPTLKRQHAELVRICTLARDAGTAFEKFSVLSLYDQKGSGEIIDQAYDNLDAALKLRSTLIRELEAKQLPGQLPHITRIAGE